MCLGGHQVNQDSQAINEAQSQTVTFVGLPPQNEAADEPCNLIATADQEDDLYDVEIELFVQPDDELELSAMETTDEDMDSYETANSIENR